MHPLGEAPHEPAPRYTLRKTKKAYMIDKQIADTDFVGEPIWVHWRTFGPFKTRDQATAYMERHGGRP